MIIKAGMVQAQFDDLVCKIDVKHKTIGIKDKELTQILAKLYNDIYCDANNGEYAFGMYKGLLNCNQTCADEAFEYFIRGSGGGVSFNRFLIHSVFVNTLCCLRRITDKDKNTQSITRLINKVECEIRHLIPHNNKVKEWCKTLQQKHTTISTKMEPLRTYIDKRISHFERKWESKMKTSKIQDIGIIYNHINEFNSTFRGFYEPNYSEIPTLISNGEDDASRFISTFHSSESLDNLKTELLRLYSTFHSSERLDNLKTELLRLCTGI